MDDNLALVCLNAFVAVLALLTLLALMMRLLTWILAPRSPRHDAAVIAVIHTAVAQAISGAKVTRIEEMKR